MPKFRKKPIVVDAVRLTFRVAIPTLEGIMEGNPGDWLITGANGETYPCKPDIFEKTYEEVVGWCPKCHKFVEPTGDDGGGMCTICGTTIMDG